MSKVTACDSCRQTSSDFGWIHVSHKGQSFDFCSPWCFHNAGAVLSALLPPPIVESGPPDIVIGELRLGSRE